MKALVYGIALQWKMDLRRKDVLVMYFLMPLAFFFFMGGIFTSINPEMEKTLIQAMTVFALCAGGYMGAPLSLTEFYHSDIKKAYRVGHIPLWTPLLNSFLTAFVNLAIVALIISVLSPLIFGSDSLGQVFQFATVTACFLAANISIGMLIGMLFKSASKVSMVSILLFLPSIMLSGIMLPDGLLPDAMQAVGNVLPARWAYQAMNGEAYLQNIALLLGCFIICMILAHILMKIKSKES